MPDRVISVPQATQIAQRIKNKFDNVNGRLHDLDEELGLNNKIEASVTTGESNVKVTLLEQFNLDLATAYKFTFTIPEAITTDIYIPIYRNVDTTVIILTLPRGDTVKEWTYTTHASVPFVDGKVQVKTTATNVHVSMTIEPVVASPSRLDTIEAELESIAPKIYTVGTGGDYQSFSACLFDLDGDTSKKEIHIYGGTYDVLEELGGISYINDLPSGSHWRTVNPIIPPNTKVIGHGNVIIKMELPSTVDNSKATLFSPVNVQGSCELKNLTITSKNCRYCIHAEGSTLSDFDNAVWSWEDLYVEKTEAAVGTLNAIGMGLNNGLQLNIKNCVVKCTVGPAIGCHDNGAQFAKSPVLSFSNTSFVGSSETGTCVTLRSTLRSNMETVIKVLFANCHITGKVQKTTANGGEIAKDVYAVTYINTEHDTVPTEYVTDIIPDTVYEDSNASKIDVLEERVNGIDVSVNRLNPFTVTVGRSMLKDGTTSSNTTMVYTDFISVKPGDRVNIVYNGVCDSNTTFRVCTAFDAQKNAVEASGRESSWAYNVPEGIYFIVLTIKKTYFESGLLAVNINGVFPYSAYNDAAANMNYLSRLIQQPYTTLPSYILDNAWYRPLGPLEKGYFCFMTDDGRMGLTEYTIPMVLDKGIKCSFALMSSSEVMQNQSDIDIVLNAISHGCEVAQHGGNRWTTYSEYGLNKYFDDEKAFFDSVGIDLHGAVIPESYNSKLIFALAGARFGVLRGGGDGHGFPLGPWYQYRTAGARSNLYGLSGYNVIDQPLATSKAAVDYALANNKIMIVYAHENELGTSQKATLEGLLDYVIETGITQVTLGDIPNLI